MNNYQYHGWTFEEFLPIHEEELSTFSPVAGSYSIIVNNDNILLCFNTWRDQWELPAGKREKNEHPKLCASRELHEETGQLVDDLLFLGLLKLKKINSFDIKYNSVYTSKVSELHPFLENDETSMITLWDGKVNIGNIDAVDMQLLKSLKIYLH